MSCKLTKTLQASVTETERLLNSDEWEPHLQTCSQCYQEAKFLDKSLELYLQLEKSATIRFPEIQIWEQIERKIQIPSNRIPFLKWTKGLAVAAAIVLLLGITMWWQSRTSPPQLIATDLPSHYQVEEVQMNQPFGPPSAQTRFIWTKQHFGIAIENKDQGSYPTISIGMNLSEEYAQAPIFKFDLYSELAYLLPGKENLTDHQQ